LFLKEIFGGAMQFVIQRETLLKPLQMIIGVVERRQTMPILSNVLLVIANKQLSMTCTDLELELVGSIELESASEESAKLTVPARKLLDICRVLPDNAMIDFCQDSDNRVVVRSNRSRFVLSTLPVDNFPNIEWDNQENVIEFAIEQKKLRYLAETTGFAMAQQDVRYYLNGLLLEIKNNMLWSVAADGHRMALNAINSPLSSDNLLRVIVPRKGIVELMRLLDDSNEKAKVSVSNNHIRIIKPGLVYTSKLIDGKFPDYERTIPRSSDKKVIIDRNFFKQALSRVAILSNDMFCGVQLQIQSGIMRMATRTQEHEEAEEEIAVDYQGEDITIGFNITYLLDILSNIESEKIIMTLKDNTNSALVEEESTEKDQGNNLYVVMPLRL
jgi:DNA polymerase-3 subunit beta